MNCKDKFMVILKFNHLEKSSRQVVLTKLLVQAKITFQSPTRLFHSYSSLLSV